MAALRPPHATGEIPVRRAPAPTDSSHLTKLVLSILGSLASFLLLPLPIAFVATAVAIVLNVDLSESNRGFTIDLRREPYQNGSQTLAHRQHPAYRQLFAQPGFRAVPGFGVPQGRVGGIPVAQYGLHAVPGLGNSRTQVRTADFTPYPGPGAHAPVGPGDGTRRS